MMQIMRSLLNNLERLQHLRRKLFAPPLKRDLVSQDFDNPDVLSAWRTTLERDRSSAKYRSVFRKSDPLVSVCVTTADRAQILAARALTSIKQQSYKNLEVIIVGDRCDDNTEAVVSGFRDKRFRFFNLTTRGPYPRPGFNRW